MIKNENYITIQGWMVNELGLSGNSLLVYAIIYGFSQDGKNEFDGTLSYLAEWCNSTKQGMINCLKGLVEKGYIIKNEKIINSVKFCSYKVVDIYDFNSIKKSLIGIKKSLTNNNININNNELLSNDKSLSNNSSLLEKNKKNLEKKEKSKTLIKVKTSKKDLLVISLKDLINKYFSLNEKIYSLLLVWLDSLKQINKLPSERGLEMSLQELKNHNEKDILESIDKSIKGGYKTFYFNEYSSVISRDGINRNMRVNNEDIHKTENYLRKK